MNDNLYEIFHNVYEYKDKDTNNHFLLTENLAPGNKVYDEKLIRIQNREFRTWNPFKSKLAAAIKCNLKHFAFCENSIVLYLGAATGTTASHISDICRRGMVYCVEFSSYAMQSLVSVCEKRTNMIPILADARKVEEYLAIGKVDIIYQDVAQPDQIRILKINSQAFLKSGGIAYLCLKARSVDVRKSNSRIFKEATQELEKDFEILEKIDISRYEKDHMFYVLRYG
ncbi:MAG: fibrillarin-like rRNA/tRNA 2'-O-methyltransferase [Candidatus Micrarchaeota archaeon]|nr:fibrillarin-like rRNA/tRNA 2'-O-methyltransferase [Candidatus Micrarchaeota archaeon]